MKKTIKTIAMLALVLGSTKAIAQNAAINSTGTAPDASAMLDVSSTTKGILTPRMTSAQRILISSPATGLLVYQTDDNTGYYFYDGASWTKLSTAGQATFLTKNANYTITATDAANDVHIKCTAATVVDFTLPLANSVLPGTKVYLHGASTTMSNINAKVSGSDLIYTYIAPSTGVTDFTASISYSPTWVILTSDGVDSWYAIGMY